jgi:hypothetical protein
MKYFYKIALPAILFLTSAFVLPSFTPAESTGLPVKNVNDLQQYISRENPYQKWELWPGTHTLYEGSRPHGAYLTTRVNDTAMGALKGGRKEFPPGSIIVKENYTESKKLTAVTVMYKVDGYNPDGGNWYWLKYRPDGTVDVDGKVGSCINCHRARMGYDWVFTEKP